jgi:hypothetical protein
VCLAHADCDDGIDCTEDACVGGQCVATPDDTLCPDDGRYCNGREICDPGEGCTSSGNPCPDGFLCDEDNDICADCLGDHQCDDGIDCTDDACFDGECVFEPDDEVCPDDGRYCNGAERCDPAGGCVSTGNPCPPALVCDEDQDRCTICLEDIDCNDRDPCTVDTCIDESCEHHPIPGCGQGSFVSRDEDNDGVLNWDDFCPNTPPDTPVDGRGCPLEPPSPAARKGERGDYYEPGSGASVGRGTGACGALGLIPVLFGLGGLRLMRRSRRRPGSPWSTSSPPPSRGLQPARRLKHEGLRAHP